MRAGVIVSSNDAETCWNALHYANFCLGQKGEVKAFFEYKAGLKDIEGFFRMFS